MGLNGEEETPVEAQLDMHNTPDGVLDPDIKNKENTDKIQFVDNPYEEDMYGEENNEDPELGQFPTICFVDIDDEIDGKTYFGSMTFIDPNDDNYAIKLASAQRADKLLSQEEIVTELVNDPVLKFKAEGQLMKKAGLKPKVSGAKPAPKTPPVFDAKFRISWEVGKYPTEHSTDLWWTLTGLIEINGTNTFILFDSSAETNALSPDFVQACQIPLLELPNPLILQKGTKGSWSCIYYGTNVDLNMLGLTTSDYFDIINIEKYDAILGAPWLNTFGALLDFRKHEVHVNGGRLTMFNVITKRSYKLMGSRAHQAKLGVTSCTISTKQSAPDQAWLATVKEYDPL